MFHCTLDGTFSKGARHHRSESQYREHRLLSKGARHHRSESPYWEHRLLSKGARHHLSHSIGSAGSCRKAPAPDITNPSHLIGNTGSCRKAPDIPYPSHLTIGNTGSCRKAPDIPCPSHRIGSTGSCRKAPDITYPSHCIGNTGSCRKAPAITLRHFLLVRDPYTVSPTRLPCLVCINNPVFWSGMQNYALTDPYSELSRQQHISCTDYDSCLGYTALCF